MEFRFLFYFKIKCLRIEPEFMVIDACKVIEYREEVVEKTIYVTVLSVL